MPNPIGNPSRVEACMKYLVVGLALIARTNDLKWPTVIASMWINRIDFNR